MLYDVALKTGIDLRTGALHMAGSCLRWIQVARYYYAAVKQSRSGCQSPPAWYVTELILWPKNRLI